MNKGQHLRLFITEGNTNKVVAMSTELNLHGSAQVENSTTKDTTDSSGAVWDENDVVGRTCDINFSALIASGTDTGGKTFADMLEKVDDEIINWKIALASGEQNRTMGIVICSGQGKMTNVQATAQVSQQSVYSGTINGYGPIVPNTYISSRMTPMWSPPVAQSDIATQNYKIITNVPMDLTELAGFLNATYMSSPTDTASAIKKMEGDRLFIYASTDPMFYITPTSGDDSGTSFDITSASPQGPDWSFIGIPI